MIIAILVLLGGLILLIAGAELLVRGASVIALALGISPLVVGLTVVAFGTSAPETVVSVVSAINGQSGVAIGNVVGSNIFNIFVVLGISASITPLVVSRQVVRLEVPVMIGVSCLMWLLSADRLIGRNDGILLFSGIIIYTVWVIRKSRRESKENNLISQNGSIEKPDISIRQLIGNSIFILGGIGFLVAGSRWFVNGAVDLASFFGISDLIIGLTIVSAGTSLPEVAASVMAAVKGERDMAVGNAVGSNLFNILAVLGVSGFLAPGGIPVPAPALSIDIPIMILVAVLCLPVFFTGHRISRKEGVFFLCSYIFYTAWLASSVSR
ncbi:MAG: calcium/sodium antiporter [Proteobacteria bacterium]|nr:calcium/sodium antiporter [Pseudomonadota bacterium]